MCKSVPIRSDAPSLQVPIHPRISTWARIVVPFWKCNMSCHPACDVPITNMNSTRTTYVNDSSVSRVWLIWLLRVSFATFIISDPSFSFHGSVIWFILLRRAWGTSNCFSSREEEDVQYQCCLYCEFLSVWSLELFWSWSTEIFLIGTPQLYPNFSLRKEALENRYFEFGNCIYQYARWRPQVGKWYLKRLKAQKTFRTSEESGKYIRKCVHMARHGHLGAPAWSTSGNSFFFFWHLEYHLLFQTYWPDWTGSSGGGSEWNRLPEHCVSLELTRN